MIRQVCNYRDSATVVYIQCRHGELTPTLDFKKKYTMVYILICLIYGSFKENPSLRCYLC